MSDRHVYLFPDTNALLHYPQIRDVDWIAVVGGSVTIVLCLQVIRELDAKKSDGRLRSRAERAIREIRDLMAAGFPNRPGVTLEVFNEELRSSDFDASLSPDSGDDRIVRHVQKYAEKTGKTDVAVYSEDLGMALRCGAHNILVIEPNKASRLEEPHSELEKKYKAAVVENQILKNQLPDIRVLIVKAEEGDSGNHFAEFTLSRTVGDGIDVENAISQERYRLSLPPPPGSPAADPPKGRGVRLSDLAAFRQPVPEDERREYNEALEAYLKEFAIWLENDFVVRSALERMIDFRVEVCNEGRAVGEDVDVYLTFPPVFDCLSGEDELVGKLPELPDRPVPPSKPDSRVLRSLHSLLDPLGMGRHRVFMPPHVTPLMMPPISTIRDPWCAITGEADKGLTLRLFLPRLNHHKRHTFGPFTGVIRSWESAKPFEVLVEFMSASHPDKRTSRSVFKVAVEHKSDQDV